jgi:ATP-dependent RNA helicase DDX31/DBP7
MAAMRKETMSTTVNPEGDLSTLAAKAWASSIKAHTSHRNETREVFNKSKLHLGHMAAAFGLEKTPADLKEMLAEERELVIKSGRRDDRMEALKLLPRLKRRFQSSCDTNSL